MNYVCTLFKRPPGLPTHGASYGPSWVNRMYRNLQRWSPGSTLSVVTDFEDGFLPEVKVYPLVFPVADFPTASPTNPTRGWAAMLEMYRPEVVGQRSILVGLDTVFTGPLKSLEEQTHGLILTNGPYNPTIACNPFVSVDAENAARIWESWLLRRDIDMHDPTFRRGASMGWCDLTWLKLVGFGSNFEFWDKLLPNKVLCYKTKCVNFVAGVTSVVYMMTTPKQCSLIGAPWVSSNWRDEDEPAINRYQPPMHKTSLEAQTYFCERIKSGDPFALVRFSKTEADVMREQTTIDPDPAKRGSSFRPQVVAHKNHPKELRQALMLRDDNYFRGVTMNCCDQSLHAIYMRMLGDLDYTFDSLFSGAGYATVVRSLTEALSGKDVYLISHTDSDLSLLGFTVKKWFSSCSNAWYHNPGLKDDVVKAATEASGAVFLFASGPYSNIMIHDCFLANGDNFYINIGSALDELLLRCPTRPYHKREYSPLNHVCQLRAAPYEELCGKFFNRSGRASKAGRSPQRQETFTSVFGCPMLGTFNVKVDADVDLSAPHFSHYEKTGSKRVKFCYWRVELTNEKGETVSAYIQRWQGTRLNKRDLELVSKTPIPDTFKTGLIRLRKFRKLTEQEVREWAFRNLRGRGSFQNYEWNPAGRADSRRVWDCFSDIDFGGKRVLDIGTNTGYFASKASKAGGIVDAVDVNADSLRLAAEVQNAIEMTDVKFHHTRDLPWQYTLEQYDVIFYLSVHHQIDPNYNNLRDTIQRLLSHTNILCLELITPSLQRGMSSDDIDRVVEDLGGVKLSSYKHKVRCHRSVYKFGG